MIKVTFKTPFYMVQDKEMCECLFLECKEMRPNNRHFCELENNILTFNYDFIKWVKSIEHVKPTDL